MGSCSGDPHLGGASWLLGLTSLLLSVCSTGTQRSEAHGSGVEDSGNPVSLKGMQGASVLFQVLRNPDLPAGVELEKMTWGISSGANYTTLLQVSPGARDPEWVNFQDKFQKRVRVLNITTLRMNNLTPEDTGLYRARDFYSRGRQYDQDFHLTVYEPLPLPQIRTTNLSTTPGWCNVTVQCDAPGTREDLTMSWRSRGLPRELEQGGAPGPAPNPWTLALSLPLTQPSASLTCVLSNQVDQKTASLDLGDICGHGECILQRGGAPGAQAALGAARGPHTESEALRQDEPPLQPQALDGSGHVSSEVGTVSCSSQPPGLKQELGKC
ncbi:SLAM family member 9-like isoform X3 [Canis lupus familiaris]|uniref:SLAM family member 9-like isoform X3 n=2 Tax=Canis lupus familiaris TaxID=9615 RepID=UPI0018F4387B|nr:SLAM family member 9-like isoform X3 [Canis lupus familiaris]